MAYRVTWRRRALDQLSEIWMNSPDRSSVSDAVRTLDRMLTADPNECGESREEDIRVVFKSPLGCRVSIDEGLNHVLVESVWMLQSR